MSRRPSIPTHVFRAARWTAHALLAGCMLNSALAAGKPEASDPIPLWVDQLDSDQFSVRQQAVRRLVDAGGAAIDPLVRAAEGSSLEVTVRAVAVLRELLLARDAETGRAAGEALSRLTESDNRSGAMRASLALGARQDLALARLMGLGAVVRHEDQPPGEAPRIEIDARWRGADAGLVYLQGVDRLQHLSLRGAQISDAGLAHVEPLTSLTWLSIRQTAVTDAGAARLAALGHLRWLSLEETQIGDDALTSLAELHELTHLYLGDTALTGEGLQRLGRLEALEYLSLKGVKLRDEHLAHLSTIAGLAHLGLDDTPVGDEALEHVRTCTGLRRLWLTRTRITDAGLARLASLDSLETLHLEGTQVSDAGLKHLYALSSLRRLYLADSKATDAGAAALEKALPNVTVRR